MVFGFFKRGRKGTDVSTVSLNDSSEASEEATETEAPAQAEAATVETQVTRTDEFIAAYNSRTEYVTEKDQLTGEIDSLVVDVNGANVPLLDRIQAVQDEKADLEARWQNPGQSAKPSDQDFRDINSQLDSLLAEKDQKYTPLASRQAEVNENLGELDRTLLLYTINMDVSGMSATVGDFANNYLMQQASGVKIRNSTEEIAAAEKELSGDLDDLRGKVTSYDLLNEDIRNALNSEYTGNIESIRVELGNYDAKTNALNELIEERDNLYSTLNTQSVRVDLEDSLAEAVKNDNEAQIFFTGYLLSAQFGDNDNTRELIELSYADLTANREAMDYRFNHQVTRFDEVKDDLTSRIEGSENKLNQAVGEMKTAVGEANEELSQKVEQASNGFRDYVRNHFRGIIIAGAIALGVVAAGSAGAIGYVNNKIDSHAENTTPYSLTLQDQKSIVSIIGTPEPGEDYNLTQQDKTDIAGLVLAYGTSTPEPAPTSGAAYGTSTPEPAPTSGAAYGTSTPEPEPTVAPTATPQPTVAPTATPRPTRVAPTATPRPTTLPMLQLPRDGGSLDYGTLKCLAKENASGLANSLYIDADTVRELTDGNSTRESEWLGGSALTYNLNKDTVVSTIVNNGKTYKVEQDDFPNLNRFENYLETNKTCYNLIQADINKTR